MNGAPTPMPVFDGHNDTLLDLMLRDRGGDRGFFEKSDRGHIDLPRAREGGLAGGLFACFVPSSPRQGWTMEEATRLHADGYRVLPAPPLDPAYAEGFAREMVLGLRRIVDRSDGAVEMALTVDHIERCLKDGILAAVLHFEGAENLGPEPGALERFYDLGLRSLGLVWSRTNAYAHGVPFRFPASPDTGPGLTDRGRELVRECNRMGVLIDLSHLNERGFWDVAGMSEAPLVASHSNAHALCPSTRNLTDRQLEAVRDSGGLVGVNFAVGFLREDGREDANTPLDTVVRHVDYLVERLGIEGVGFGSDFDGAKVPEGIGDAAGLPSLLGALRESGYDEDSLRKLAHENWLRVLKGTWRGG